MIFLRRTPAGRATGSKMAGIMLMEIAKLERPYMNPPFMDDKFYEYWNVEKQFWLKHKKEFQDLGFLPFDNFNVNKKIPTMLEKF